MRENRPYGSEGGEGNLPDPYRGGAVQFERYPVRAHSAAALAGLACTEMR